MLPTQRRPLSPAAALAALCGLALLASPVRAAGPALSRANLDTTVAPCRDFYRYANGGWLDRTRIPAAYSSWGSFEELQERNEKALREILERAAASKTGSAAMIGTYYSACMDSTAAEAAGTRPIEPLLLAVDGMKSADELAAEVAWLHAHAVSGMFAFRSGQDPRHSEWVIAFAGQGGLGLPDRDYYFRVDSSSVATRAKYVAHIARSFELLGTPAARAAASADRVMALEAALAKASMTNVQRRDPRAVYHKVALDSLRHLAPRFDWKGYLVKRGAPSIDSVNVTQPDFVRAVDSLIAAVPLEDWKAYLRWKIVDDAAPTLTRAFAEEDFRFEQVLSGAEVMQPRWKRCLRATDGDLGDLLGKAYVKERFSPAARERALQMVTNLEDALRDRIAVLDWMGPETRQRALEKLQAFENKIGYPNTWRDYAGVELSRRSWFANRQSAQAYEAKRNLDKIGRPVDRGEWNMSAPTVNAFYSSSLNSINFPAGILQPPFYDPDWDDAMNYGAIGAVIGHEMSHGFDDRGRQFDAKGNLRDWWTEQDATAYKGRATRVSEQFDGYTVLDSLHINGKLTLGENIADLGGIAVAYHALQKALESKRVPAIDGFTPDQRFFLSYAQVWREVVRPASLRTQVQTDPHSPGEWRVNGPLSNLPEFEAAFGCRKGDAMVRDDEKRARIW